MEPISTPPREFLARYDPEILVRLERIERQVESPDEPAPTPASIMLSLNPGSIAERVEQRAGGPARALDQLRNTLTIAPLVVTWLSLGLAMANYSYLTDRQLLPRQESFLSAWQAGFHGRGFLPAPTFTEMAVLDVALLTVLLVTSLLLHWAAQRAAGRGQIIQSLLEERVPELMNQAAIRHKQAERRDAALTFAGDPRQLADLEIQLARLTAQTGAVDVLSDRLTEVSDRLATNLAGLHSLRQDFQGALNGMIDHAAGLTDATRSVLAAHAHLRATLDNLSARLAEQGDAAAERQAGLDALAQQVGRQARELEDKLAVLILRVPSARSVADDVAGAWAIAQAQHLGHLNQQLELTLQGFSETLEASLERALGRPDGYGAAGEMVHRPRSDAPWSAMPETD